jgi:hypothetical protein
MASPTPTPRPSTPRSISASSHPRLNPLRFSFLDPVSTGNGFDGLRLQIFKEFAPVFDQSFTSASAATLFFNDKVLDFGPANAGLSGETLDLQLIFTYTSDSVGDSYSVDFLTSVPEPSTTLLLAASLGFGLGVRRSRPRRC